MSRYHSVRPKKHKHKRNHAPQPAAPAQPTPPAMPSYAQAEKMMLEQLEKARTELYKLRNGDVLDASIARWKRMLAIYDREAEIVFAGDMSRPHRWTVSPAMALRAEKHLESLLQRQSALLDQCHADAGKIVSEHYAALEKAESLCPPKHTPAPEADSGADETPTSNVSNEGGPPEALKPAA
jgi:hypothetical protein